MKGVFKAKDQGSSNGTFVNGQVYAMDESIELKTNDVLILGKTKFVFLAIPEF
ncbi:MAG: FHA domain-containing protein [Bacteroidales bacterium]|nr:FHA domain-containing protein [Bacteroidales bacterium]